MKIPFERLAPDYKHLLEIMRNTRAAESRVDARRLLKYFHRYETVSSKTGIPIVFIAASFERESGSDFLQSPAQGDPWNKKSVHVPKGRGPFKSWEDAAIDAYHIDALDQVGKDNWTWERACYEGELFNGFGYRAHGVHSPYLWAGTNIYSSGKYISDGHYDAAAKDRQIGIIPLMVAMIELDPSLSLINELPSISPPAPIPEPAFGLGVSDVKWLQDSLNQAIPEVHLLVDGNYGRRTKAAVVAFQKAHGLLVDGIPGIATRAALASATIC